MTNKESFLDCLADDSEDELSIKEMLKYSGINLSIEEIHEIANEFLDQGLIYIDETNGAWRGYQWYGMTEKGREWWSRIIS